MDLSLAIGLIGLFLILLQLVPVLKLLGNGSLVTHYPWFGEENKLLIPLKGTKENWRGFITVLTMIAFAVRVRDEEFKTEEIPFTFSNSRMAKKRFEDMKTVTDEYFYSNPVLELGHELELSEEKIIIRIWRVYVTTV